MKTLSTRPASHRATLAQIGLDALQERGARMRDIVHCDADGWVSIPVAADMGKVIRVTLTGDDTFHVEYLTYSRTTLEYAVADEVTGVLAEQLGDTFRRIGRERTR